MAKTCALLQRTVVAIAALLFASVASAASMPCPNIDICGGLKTLSLAPYSRGADPKTFTDLRKGDQLADLGQVYGLFIGSYPSKPDAYFHAVDGENHAPLAMASHDSEVRGVRSNIPVAL